MSMMNFHTTKEDREAFGICISHNYRVYPEAIKGEKDLYIIEIQDGENTVPRRGKGRYKGQECWEKIFELYRHKAQKINKNNISVASSDR